MSEFDFLPVLQCCGKSVTLVRANQESREEGLALIQARALSGRQFIPSPLGVERCESFLYLGEAGLSLDGMEEGYLICDGVSYGIESAQAVYIGKELSHWRAVLRMRDEVSG